MLCTYFLGSVLVTLTFIDHFAAPSPAEVAYEELNIQSKEKIQSMEVQQCNPVPVGDREPNLKYVLMIKSLTIWQTIKKRILTIKTQSKIGEIVEKSPEKLNDNELVELRQICQDGLKCVSVDQLIVLKMVLKSTDNSEITVRQVVTNITKVLTEYTTACHQDMYEYAVIKDSDDMNKVNRIMTTIVDDNKVLCEIDVNAAAGENETKIDDTTKTKVSDGITKNDGTTDNGILHLRHINTDGINAVVHSKNTDSIDSQPNSMHKTSPTNVTTEQENVMLYDSNNTASNNNTSRKTNHSNITNASMNTNKTSNSEEPVDSNAKHYKNNFIDLENDGNDENDENDIASSGFYNKNVTRNGIVKNGIINNGKMNVYNINNGTINKGIIRQAKGTKGIISVGTVNNGPTNYGVVNNGTNVKFNEFNTKEYLSSINNMFSTILKHFGNV